MSDDNKNPHIFEIELEENLEIELTNQFTTVTCEDEKGLVRFLAIRVRHKTSGQTLWLPYLELEEEIEEC